jgi:hypothetical protein
MPHHVVQPPPSTHTTPQDSFYRPLTPEEAANVADFNFDHPDAFDTPLLLECMSKLKAGCAVEVPVYDFATHSRSSTTRRVRPAGGGGGWREGFLGRGAWEGWWWWWWWWWWVGSLPSGCPAGW